LRVQLWANAQKEIGIKPNYEELRKSDEITRFYGGFSFGFSAFIFNNTPVFYTRIWKNANSGIRTSFFVNNRANNRGNFCPKGGTNCTPVDFDYLEENYETVAREHEIKTNNSIKSFSFVRRPLSHFQSGLTEYFWLWNLRANNAPGDAIGKLDPEKLQRFLHALIDVTKPPPDKVFTPYESRRINVAHVFPQATVFREKYGPHLIGRLETFDEDWRSIEKEFGITSPMKKELGKRQSSADEAQVIPAWNQLLSQRPEYLRALCWLLLPDFFCYNYPLPTECQNIAYSYRSMRFHGRQNKPKAQQIA